MRDQSLYNRLTELSKSSVVNIQRLTGSEIDHEVGITLRGSSNPLYRFRTGKDADPLEAIAYTSILNAQARPATRAEALGQAISAYGTQIFDRNPFLLIFDYSTNRFMAVSAAKLFSAFAEEAQKREIPYSGTAHFSLTPNFSNHTVNMYGSVGSEDVWFCNDLSNLTAEDVVRGLDRIRADSREIDRDLIVEAVRQRIQAQPTSDGAFPHEVMGRMSYTASLITQGRHKFYSLTMPSEILGECSFVLTRDEDRDSGFQRYLSKDRAEEIAAYLDAGLGTIPTSVILSAQPDAEFEYTSKNRTVSFKRIPNAFMIIDGQHRVYGFRLAKGTMRVPVIIYGDLDRSEEAQLFIDINGKQKPVPPELLLDIKKLANTQGGMERQIGIVFDLFDSEPGSSLLGMLSPHEKKIGYISRVTFNAAIKPLMELFGEAPPEKIYETLNPYFESVKAVLPKLADDIDFTSPMTFRGMTIVFPEINEKVQYRYSGVVNQKNYYAFLLEMLSGQKLTAFKGKQKSYAGLVSAVKNAIRPRTLI